MSANERQVLRALWADPGLSRSELTSRLDLTQQSLHRIVDQLVLRGMIRLGPPHPAAGRGQPSPTLTLLPCFAHSWGVSLNTDDLGIALMDFSGKPLVQEQHRLQGVPRKVVLDRLTSRIGELTAEHDIDPEACLGIGFGIAGYWVGGTRFNSPLPLKDWALIELGPLLSQHFNRPVWVENGANTSAVGEAMLGAGKIHPTFAYMSFNYGLGGGLIQNGELWRGGNNNAGELSGIFGPEELDNRPILQSLVALLRKNGVGPSHVGDLARDFDPDWPGVDQWVDQVMPAFNRLVAVLWSVFDPQAIVLGGQIPPALASRLIKRATIHHGSRYGVPRPAPRLLVSELGVNASALGAAALPLRVCAL
ncbi:ROK family transcriptional regulator [Falsirhodobacter deserti]|uniref:ROK family transcriptional regulator n=1 Tax=Falsirhodobacter deserti TaxID=1365611 RepID=UPI001F4E1402|nr:ROK family transcriptional regulator [Falsirhodobacter deserti]